MDAGEPCDLLGKRTLIEISRTIERFALAAPADEPLVVMAMFQKLSYFEQASATYRSIAARGAVTVVGMAENSPPPAPPGIHAVLFGSLDELAREWSVVVLGPHGGATLVATDLETIDPVARTLEDGRMFRARWSFCREDARAQVRRLRAALRLPGPVRVEIDRVLAAVAEVAEPPNQKWWNAPMRFLAGRVEDIDRRRTAAEMQLDALDEDNADRDPRTGLYTVSFFRRWTEGLGAGTLAIGLAFVHVDRITEVRSKYGLRAELAALRGVAGCVQDLLTPVDRAVRLGREDFLVVLPSWAPEKVLWFCEEVCRRMGALDQQFPFVSLPGVTAATVTRNRPLPVERLRRQVRHSSGPSGPVSVLSS